MKWQLGTVGFGYKQWLGAFYPHGTASGKFLEHYARFFDSAEIDSTFYGIPKQTTVQGWFNKTPAHFTFSPKTPRFISHETLLHQSAEPMQAFVDALQPLEHKLGAILIQFPPSLTFDFLPDLKRFVDGLPPDKRFAIEFRDASWRRGRVLELLRAHNIAWVGADYIHLPPEVHQTADFTYLRFIGIHNQFATKDKELVDHTDRLIMWHDQLKPHLDNFTHVYGYFNNDYSGHSPATCNRFKTMVGLEASYPKIFQQRSLF